jgi:trimeric autotransporter adhesin
VTDAATAGAVPAAAVPAAAVPAGAASGSGPANAPAADPASLLAEVSGLAQLVNSVAHDGRSGWKTTEFWASITTWLLPVLTLVFHRDLSSLATPLAVVAAGAAQAVYTISRAITKKGHATALASMATASPAMLAAASSASASASAAALAASSAAPTAPSALAATGAGAGSPGLAAPPVPAGLTGADGAPLVQAMTAALQALTAAVEKLSGSGQKLSG